LVPSLFDYVPPPRRFHPRVAINAPASALPEAGLTGGFSLRHEREVLLQGTLVHHVVTINGFQNVGIALGSCLSKKLLSLRRDRYFGVLEPVVGFTFA